MHKSKKTVVAAILAAGLMTGTAYAQQTVTGQKGMKASQATPQMRSDRQARAQVRTNNRAWHHNRAWHDNRAWHRGGYHAGWQHPFGWPGAAAAGAGYAAGSILGGTLGAAGAVVGAPFGAYDSYAYAGDGFGYHGGRRDCLGDYDSAGVRCRY